MHPEGSSIEYYLTLVFMFDLSNLLLNLLDPKGIGVNATQAS